YTLARTGGTTKFVILKVPIRGTERSHTDPYRGSAFSPRILATFLLFALISGTFALAQKPITVPLEVLRTGHAAVKVTINGKGPFRLALDTGSPVTFVSNACAAKIGILTKEEAASPALFQLPRSVKTIEVGGAKLKDLSVMIIDHPT